MPLELTQRHILYTGLSLTTTLSWPSGPRRVVLTRTTGRPCASSTRSRVLMLLPAAAAAAASAEKEEAAAPVAPENAGSALEADLDEAADEGAEPRRPDDGEALAPAPLPVAAEAERSAARALSSNFTKRASRMALLCTP
mmetsp:Transcript_18971/g.52600  ORF Transcript_18971/g.52600 Transcript_18971/m.52600 type:complete len:140 (+) Transcript_18971:88-507(+)